MRLTLQYLKPISTGIAMATIVFCFAFTANAQSAAELVEKAKTAIENNQFDLAIAASTKAIGIDAKNWAAYKFRGVAREKRAEDRKTGYSTAAEKSEWNSIFDDLAKAAELSDQDMSAYMELYILGLKAGENGLFGRDPAFVKTIEGKLAAFFAARIADNPHNVCARTFMIHNGTPSELIRQWVPAVENFDNVHGGECVGLAATRIAENLVYESGDREFNKKEAKRYYEIAQKADPSRTPIKDDEIATAFADAAPKAAKDLPTTAPTPVSTPVSVSETKPTLSPVSAAEAALQARVDEFLKEYNRTMDEVAPLIDDATNAMKKLVKASQEDLKYGTSTVNLYTGTRRRAQTQLDTVHRKYRELIRKYEGSIPSMFINELKKEDRSLPETVD